MRAILITLVSLIGLSTHLLAQEATRNDDAPRETLNIALHSIPELNSQKILPLGHTDTCSACIDKYKLCRTMNTDVVSDCWAEYQDCLNTCHR
jgi:hypothetical protein